MKNLKTVIFGVFIALLTITSCTNDEATISTNNTESASVKTALTELRTHFNENGTLNPNENPVGNILFDFCFDFVYPITLNYNTGTDVTVNNFNELVTIILASTDTLFINGISFPFQVETYEQNQIVISTISNEQEFITLILSCAFNNDVCDCTGGGDPVCVEINDVNGEPFTMEFPNACYALCDGFTPNDFVDCEGNGNPVGNDDCFEYNYPISVIFQNETTVINSDDEFEIFIYGNNGDFQFVYPFDVTVEINGDSQVLTINNELEYIALLDGCEDIDCEDECPQEYNPVCVLAPNSNELIEFQNMCYAECEGFTQNDIVPCNPTGGDCEITNVTVIVGNCIDTGNYTITLDFDVENATDDYFDLYSYDGVFLSSFEISELPLTVTLTDQPNTDENSFNININDNLDCTAEISWTEPDCNNSTCVDDCPTEVDPVCVATQNGEIIEFNNECLALCAGYTPNNFVNCNPSGGDDLAEVVSVVVSGSENAYTFNVGVLSPDTGCNQYADWWEVLTLNGELIYRRILTHSHVNEQPFVRSGSPVDVSENQIVIIRAHMNTSSYGYKTYKGSVANGFESFETDTNFATDLENQQPLPNGCAF